MSSQNAIPRIFADAENDPAGAPVIGTLHLMLAATAIIAFIADADADAARNFPTFGWAIFFCFAANNIYLYLQAHRLHPASDSRTTLWLEVFWYSAMMFATGGGRSIFFPFYVFNILICAFRFGFAESARITVASAVMFSLTALTAPVAADLVALFLRVAFLLSLGYLIAVWGESNLRQKRGLALLREVSSLSNPRFGIDRTIASIMERCRVFFNGDSCILVSHRPRSRHSLLRIARPEGVVTEPLDAVLAPLLLAMPEGEIATYTSPTLAWLRRGAGFRTYDAARREWRTCADDKGRNIAELLGARSFVSLPLNFRAGNGRVYMTSSRRAFTDTDAIFLGQVVAQVLPVIETIHLLDRLASRAALRERLTIAHDLHDSTVQPYIGLSHTLAALRNKADADNPLKADIDSISAMAAEVVADLRRFAGQFARTGQPSDQMVRVALRRSVQKAKQFYGIDIALDISGEAHIGDRLAAAVIQLGSEGISNICRHTEARHGALRIACEGRWLRMEVENDSAQAAPSFVPTSLTRRSAALGGTIRVEHRPPGQTIIRIDIPV